MRREVSTDHRYGAPISRVEIKKNKKMKNYNCNCKRRNQKKKRKKRKKKNTKEYEKRRKRGWDEASFSDRSTPINRIGSTVVFNIYLRFLYKYEYHRAKRGKEISTLRRLSNKSLSLEKRRNKSFIPASLSLL